jgi:hypothetical protein
MGVRVLVLAQVFYLEKVLDFLNWVSCQFLRVDCSVIFRLRYDACRNCYGVLSCKGSGGRRARTFDAVRR